MTKRELNLRKNKASLLARIARLDKTIAEISESSNRSATLSAGGGSQSYTYASLKELEEERSKLAARVAQINDWLAGRANGSGIRHIMTVRNGGMW